MISRKTLKRYTFYKYDLIEETDGAVIKVFIPQIFLVFSISQNV